MHNATRAVFTADDAYDIVGNSSNPSLPPADPPPDSDYMEVPVVGLPGPTFMIIHTSALISISSSVLVSTSLLIYLCTCSRRRTFGIQSDETATSQSTISVITRQGATGGQSGSTSKVESPVDNGNFSYCKASVAKLTRARR